MLRIGFAAGLFALGGLALALACGALEVTPPSNGDGGNSDPCGPLAPFAPGPGAAFVTDGRDAYVLTHDIRQNYPFDTTTLWRLPGNGGPPIQLATAVYPNALWLITADSKYVYYMDDIGDAGTLVELPTGSAPPHQFNIAMYTDGVTWGDSLYAHVNCPNNKPYESCMGRISTATGEITLLDSVWWHSSYYGSEVLGADDSFVYAVGQRIPVDGGKAEPRLIVANEYADGWFYVRDSQGRILRSRATGDELPVSVAVERTSGGFVADSTGIYSALEQQPFGPDSGAETSVAYLVQDGFDGGVSRLIATSHDWISIGPKSLSDQCVWWMTENGVSRAPKTAGTAVTDAAPPPTLDSLATKQSAVALATDGTNVYWTNSDGTVAMCPRTGCNDQPIVLASQQQDPQGIATDGTNVYWSNHGGGSIASCSVKGCGGNPTVFATGQSKPLGVATGSGNVYWTTQGVAGDGSDSTVMTCAASGCGNNPTVLVTGAHVGTRAIAQDANNVYWFGGDYGTAMSCSVTGCANKPTVQGVGSPASLSSDGTYLYTIDNGSYGNGGLFQHLIGGNSNHGLASFGGDPTAKSPITSGGGKVYWGRQGGVFAVPANGGPVTTVSTVELDVTDIAVDQDNLYWIAQWNGSSAIRKATLRGLQ